MDIWADRALGANGIASAMMSEHQRQTAFLRQCLLYDDTAERHKLEARITELQRDEICVRRAVWLMALLAALAMAGLCYAAVFVPGHPLNLSEYTGRPIIKLLCALGVGSLICLLAFLGLGVIYRKELDQRREECRRLARSSWSLVWANPARRPCLGSSKTGRTLRTEATQSCRHRGEMGAGGWPVPSGCWRHARDNDDWGTDALNMDAITVTSPLRPKDPLAVAAALRAAALGKRAGQRS